MALDPSDLLGPPYSFGECDIYDTLASAHCGVFKNEDISFAVSVRKQGNWVKVIIPNILEEVKSDQSIDFETLTIHPFLPEELLGENPRKRYFGGLARAFEMTTNVIKTVPAIVTMEKDGTININPSNKLIEQEENGSKYITSDNFFFVNKGYTGKIGTLTFEFTYIIDDEHTFDDDIKLSKINQEEIPN